MSDWSCVYYQRFKTQEEKFWEKVNIKNEDDCWDWKAHIDSRGYGKIRFNGIYTPAHRVSWILHYQEIPEGLFVCHKCDNPSCVNPKHLFLGTNADNMLDMWNKDRHPIINMGRPSHTMIGIKNVNAKLSIDDVKNIRELYTSGISQDEISIMYKVQKPAIWKIVHRKTWKHI